MYSIKINITGKKEYKLNKLLLLISLMCFLLAMSAGLSTETAYAATGAEYFNFDPGTGMITGYNAAGGLDVTIPDTINDVPVIGINSNAFSNKGLTSVVIPDSIKTIGANAFNFNPITTITIGYGVDIVPFVRLGRPEYTTMGDYGLSFYGTYNTNALFPGIYTYDLPSETWSFVPTHPGKAELEAAIAAADAANPVVTISQNYYLTSNLTIDKPVVFNTDEAYGIYTNKNYIDIVSGGDLTMEGNLTVLGRGNYVIKVNNNFTLNGGTVKNTGNGVVDSYVLPVLVENGTVTFNDGMIKATGDYSHGIYGTGIVTVNGGTIETTYTYGIGARLDSGNFTMTGGTVLSPSTGVSLGLGCTGTINGGNIEGGPIGVKVGGTAYISENVNIAATGKLDADSFGVVVDGQATISGGAITSVGKGVVVASGGTTTISGGTITSTDTGVAVGGGVATITGGTITSATSAVIIYNGTVNITAASGLSIDNGVYWNYTYSYKAFLTELPVPISMKVDQTAAVTLQGVDAGVSFGIDAVTPMALGAAIVGNTVTLNPTAAGQYNLVLKATYSATYSSATLNLTIPVTVEMTDAGAVTTDANSLTADAIKGGNPDLNNVAGNLTLPTGGANGTTISWVSDNASIANDGTVTRAVYGAGDTVVTLTATVSKGAASETKQFDVTVLQSEQTDAEAVTTDANSLTADAIKGGNPDLNNVTGNLTLPTGGANGTTISWGSGHAAIANDGTVTRPDFGAGNAVVTITATISKGEESDTKSFTVTVLKIEQTDAEAVTADLDALTIDSITFSGSDTANNVTGNITLPVSGNNGTLISWGSDNAAVAISGETGTVTRPDFGAGDAVVTLTATMSKGVESDTKSFTVTVLEREHADAAAVTADANALTEDIIKGGNPDLDNVTGNLTLPTGGDYGTSISWTSTNTDIVSVTGAVYRPPYTGSDAVVTVTANISKNAFSDTKSFAITVLKMPATDEEAVSEDVESMAIGFAPGDDASSVTRDLVFPARGNNGSIISWLSDKPEIISNTGKVTRPPYAGSNTEVTVTASVYKNGVSEQKPFYFTVLTQSMNNTEAVNTDKENLTIDSITFNGDDTADRVTGNIILPTSGNNGTVISWQSDSAAIIVSGGTGIVTRPLYSQGDATVTLTATITKGDVTETKTFNLVVVKAPPESTSGGGGNTTQQQNGSKSTETGTRVIINGQEQIAGKEIITEENGNKTAQVVVESDTVNNRIDEVLKGQQNLKPEEQKEIENTLEVTVAAEDAKKITAALTGDMVKKMEENEFELSVKTRGIDYIIAAEEIGIENAAETLGVAKENLKDIEVEVIIKQVDDQITRQITEMAKENKFQIIIPPVNFTVVAKTKSTMGEEKEITIAKFKQYVERIMEIPQGVELGQITTGVVYNADGTFAHVPTEVFIKDGIYYAKISSFTNSSYSVIWNPVTVAAVQNHWSKESVDDMASRLVIKNPENFAPNEEITRGDFAEYITKAIGVYRINRAKINQFTDVAATDELADAVTIAAEYGIIKGYPDGTFKPDAKISREEAMAMYARAMDIVKLAEVDNNRIAIYQDVAEVADWSYEAVKKTVSAGVFNGRTKDTIEPKATFTYAEAATAIRNLLIESELINR